MLVLALALPVCAVGKVRPKEDAHAAEVAAAKKVALAWLELVDAENYDAAYDQYSEGAKRRVKSKEQSVAFYEHIRKPHGAPLERRMASEQFATTLPMLPTGEYVLIDFLTDFTDKKGVKEEVLLERVARKWVVSGYACGK